MVIASIWVSKILMAEEKDEQGSFDDVMPVSPEKVHVTPKKAIKMTKE